MAEDGPVITARTKTTLGAIFTMVVVLFGAYSYMESRFNSLDRRLEKLEESAERANNDQWSRSDQRLWVTKAGAANPTLNLPEIK